MSILLSQGLQYGIQTLRNYKNNYNNQIKLLDVYNTYVKHGVEQNR